MSLDQATVRHIALLARLELTEEEEATYTQQLGAILQYIGRIEELATEGVEPTAQLIEVSDPLRDDRVTNPPASDALRNNAPALDGDFFKVPKIIE